MLEQYNLLQLCTVLFEPSFCNCYRDSMNIKEAPQAQQPRPVRSEALYRILLVDDNEDFAATFSTLLKTLGHEVRIAHDGVQALEVVARFIPDVAFLDIGLPRLNGYDLVRRMRAVKATQQVLLIAVTGWGQEDDRLRALEAGFDHHLVKPVEVDDIRYILDNFRPAT